MRSEDLCPVPVPVSYPNGIPSLSPRLARSAHLGYRPNHSSTATRLHHRHQDLPNLVTACLAKVGAETKPNLKKTASSLFPTGWLQFSPKCPGSKLFDTAAAYFKMRAGFSICPQIISHVT